MQAQACCSVLASLQSTAQKCTSLADQSTMLRQQLCCRRVPTRQTHLCLLAARSGGGGGQTQGTHPSREWPPAPRRHLQSSRCKQHQQLFHPALPWCSSKACRGALQGCTCHPSPLQAMAAASRPGSSLWSLRGLTCHVDEPKALWPPCLPVGDHPRTTGSKVMQTATRQSARAALGSLGVGTIARPAPAAVATSWLSSSSGTLPCPALPCPALPGTTHPSARPPT